MTHLGLVTVVVRDYDEAVPFYRTSSGSSSWMTPGSTRASGGWWSLRRARGKPLCSWPGL
ncbi:hypothetical protein ABT115_30445 [Streptomyces sp. NPDC001832]|uniref:hypothetical protein n=1 Tax=Streptomyces sp. NPDC001832 TaxID=3154527 RepID=UPI003318937A